MCGFVGIGLDDRTARSSEELLRRMAHTLQHRGPDDSCMRVLGPLGVGFRRLSIIDLAGGQQPFLNAAGDLASACNGEIYNFRDLRRELEPRGHRFRSQSDCESVLHLYEEHGPSLCTQLVGMFALCVLDQREPERPRVFLARDRIGIKPLFYARIPSGLIWASEPKALLEHPELGRELRAPALLDYLVQGYVSGEDSAWGGIRRLPAGCCLSWSPGEEPRVTRYWDLPLDGPREPAEGSEILEWIDRVVADRLMSDVPLGAFLSGGIDSTAVLTSMARENGAPIACSVGFHEKSHNELETAMATAQRLGATHHTEILEPDPSLALEVLPWFFDEPLADPSTVPTYLVSRMAREHVTVALSGDGGDETFAGYRRYVFDVAESRLRRALGRPGRALVGNVGRVYPKLDWAPRCLRAKSVLTNLGREPARAYWSSLTQMERDEAAALLSPELRDLLRDHDPFQAFEEHYRRPRGADGLYRAQYADFHGFLPDQILTKTDRASMGVSLEVRVPLLDHRFVERFANLPTGEKVRSGRGKHALREALRPRIPASVLDGRKMGFDTPLRAWIRGPLARVVKEAIESLPESWFDRNALRARFEEHESGRRDRSNMLWSLLVLEHWRRRHSVTDLCS